MEEPQSGIKRLWNEDRDVKRVAAVMFAALACGALLVVLATPTGQAPAGLLWAAACSSVGWFLGFLFGIPRTLSTDTARTTLPDRDSASFVAASKAAASRASAEKLAKDKIEAEQNASARAADANSAAENAANAAKQAEQNPDDQALASKSVDAKAAADKAMNAKTAAEEAATAAASKAKKAADQAEADQAEVTRLSATNADAETAPQLGASDGPSTTVNTNLEQISDWLTKIIVGVTLVESKAVLDHIAHAATIIAGSIGGETAVSVSFAFAILIYFSSSGLLGSYLLTRLFLQRAFTTAATLNKGL